ncbi:MAG: type II secretion system F family protein [Acidimicrobiia bacterium]|nr:type II secretion system F family protein [Acidimicrobiia bacterium]
MTVVLCVVLVVALVRCGAAASRETARARVRQRSSAPHDGSAGRALHVLPLQWSDRLVGRFASARAARRYEEALPDALDHLAAGIRAGASVPQALDAAATRSDAAVGEDLASVVAAVEQGTALDDALRAWCGRRPLRGVELTATALDLGSRFGGRQATAVDAVSDAVRTRLALRREVRALSAQARASAWVMAATPIAFAAFSAALDPRVATMLLGSVLGWGCLSGGIALDAVAAVWMRRINESALGAAV